MNTTAQVSAGSVVVGVDGSEHAQRALEWAATQAAADRRPLVVVNAVGTLGTSGTVWIETLQDAGHVFREMIADGETVANEASAAAAKLYPALEVQTVVEAEDPRQLLLRLAATASMVVVGSRGRGPVRSMLLGSVGMTLVRHAPCPVVVVRPHHRGVVRRGVLVGVDGTPESRATLEFAYHQASVRRLPLTVVHAVWTLPGDTADRADSRLLLAESVAGLSEKYPEVRVQLEPVDGSPGRVLAEAADQIDLVVVGRHRRRLLDRAVRGDVGAAVVEHARTVVAVVPEGDDL